MRFAIIALIMLQAGLALAGPAEEEAALKQMCSAAVHIRLGEGQDPDERLPPTDRRAAFILSNEIRSSFPLTEPILLAFAHDRDIYRESPRASLCPNGTPIIILNPKFAADIREAEPGRATFWKWLFIFYHEVTHVLLRHTHETQCTFATEDEQLIKRSVEREKEADLWSGFKLALMGASLDETRAALESWATIAKPGRTSHCHPTNDLRLEAAKTGWDQAFHSRQIKFGTSQTKRQFEPFLNTDIIGYDLFSFPTISIHHCAATCLGDRLKRCSGLSYSKKNRFCYLKTALGKDDNPRPFTDTDKIFTYDIWSETWLPNAASNSTLAMRNKPADAPKKNYEEDCSKFEFTDEGRELYAIPIYEFDVKAGGIVASRDQCRSNCRKREDCRAMYYDGSTCKFYKDVGSVRPSFQEAAEIHVKRFAYDPKCKLID